MKVVVTGGGGQLGQALFSMRNENVEIVPLTVTQCDVTDEQQVYRKRTSRRCDPLCRIYSGGKG